MEKNQLLILLSFLTFSVTTHGYAQEIDKVQVDDFSGDTTITTTWEPLSVSLTPDSFVRIRKFNQAYYLDFRIIRRSVFTVYQNQNFILLDGEKQPIKFRIPETKVCCMGCGAKGLTGFKQLGMELSFPISTGRLLLLQGSSITNFRLETKESNIDKEVPKKYQPVISFLTDLVTK